MCINWPQCPSLDLDEKKWKLIISMIAGITFFSGWWIFIDAAVTYTEMSKHKIYYAPGILGTIAMIIVNITPYRINRDDMLYNDNKCNSIMTLTTLFFALVISFGTFTWSFYILIADFLLVGVNGWTGAEIMLQNACILTSNLMLKFSKEKQIEF